MPRKTEELIPSAYRLISSLRDIGYDFQTAVADLVDNSIEARATRIIIDVQFEGDESWVRISDNGVGMNADGLREAMRYGSKKKYEADDLGKFGLGLKTASLSQCKRLTVATRCSTAKIEIKALCWDLNHVSKTNKWEVLPVESIKTNPLIGDPLTHHTGTVVIWQQIDRILGYALPYGESARKRMGAMCRNLENHLGAVFHKFISGEVRGRKLQILLNGNEVSAWDPFARKELKTKALSPIRIEIEHEGVRGFVDMEPYILPAQDQFSSMEAFKLAGGLSNWNQQQGFYIYRSNRLIQSGGWSKTRTADEHTKLARIALKFSPKLDEAFKINVAKMRVQLPLQLKEQIEQPLRDIIRKAQEGYRKKEVGKIMQQQTAHSSGKEHTQEMASDTPAHKWNFDEMETILNSVALANERPIISRVISRLRNSKQK
jgi:hypothetical protein